MSAAEGSKEFKKKLKEALDKSRTYQAIQENYRQKLNTENIHILDLSYNTLMVNAVTADQKARFPDSYKLFKLSIEKAKPPTYANLTEFSKANPKLLVNNEVVYISDRSLLICANFRAGRLFITNKISRNMPSDEFFGISNRARSISELRSEGYEVFPINIEEHEANLANYIGGWRVKSPRSGKLWEGDRYFNNEGLELDRKDRTQLLIRELSNLDIGHLYTRNAKDAPLGFKLNRILNVESISGSLKTVVENAIENLMGPPEARIDFNFENLLPKNYKQAGTLLLRLEFYKLNGEKAFIETGIYNKVREEIVNEIKKDLINIPGSNTMLQDFLESVENGLVAALSGKPRKKLAPHSPVIGTLTDKQKSKKVKTSAQTLKLGSNPPTGKTPPAVNYSLASLQLLLNTHLQDVISANMGSGSSRDILNYRAGRFAASAKVERISQSREGMITAFYSYMKNPYQTFEPGYRQGFPKTRDPKLLIAKSIRDIAATKVANRMRAVLI